MKAIKRLIVEQQHAPGALGPFVNPFYLARKALREQVTSLGGEIRGRVLDVGCGRKPYARLFAGSEYVGLEVKRGGATGAVEPDVLYDGERMPFKDGAFDAVIASQVLEHVFAPEPFLEEIGRVLRPGGLFLVTVPFVWDEHEKPHDFARYSSFGLRHLLEKGGFDVVDARKTGGGVRAIFQLVNAYLYKLTASDNNYVNLAWAVLAMSPFNIAGEILARLLPEHEDLYLDNVVLARKGGLEDG